MRIERDENGNVYIVDEEIVLGGDAARAFEKRNREGTTPEQAAHLEDCLRIYERLTPKAHCLCCSKRADRDKK